MTDGSPGGRAAHSRRIPFPPTWTGALFGLVTLSLGVLFVVTKDALAPYIIALVLVFLMNGLVDRLQRAGVPRPVGTIVTLLALVIAIVLFVYVMLSALIEQFVNLVQRLPDVAEATREWLLGLNLSDEMYEAISRVTQGLLEAIPDAIPTVFGAVLTGVGGFVALFMAIAGVPFWIIYALSDSPAIMQGLRRAIPAPYRTTVFDSLAITGDVFGAWGRGQAVLAVSVGVPFLVGFSLIGAFVDPNVGQYALLFATTLALAEFVPIIGPIIVFVPIIIITFAIAGVPGGIAVGALFIVIEQLEGAVLIPRVQGRALRLHPVVILPALAVGSALAGLMGAILALPVTATIRRVVAYLFTVIDREPDERIGEPGARPEAADSSQAAPDARASPTEA